MHRRILSFAAATVAAFSAATVFAAASCPLGLAAPIAYDRGTVGIRTAVAAGDLNGDGLPDIVSLHRYDEAGRIGSILINRGHGVFEPLPLMLNGADFSIVVLADVNGDNKPDLVLGGISGLSVLPGKGDGTFGTALSTQLLNITAIAAGDFDENGTLDLAVTQSNPSAVTILAGDGHGGFHVGSSYALTGGGNALVVNDLNGDHHLDLAVADKSGVIPFFGSGKGTFTAGARIASYPGATALASADLNGDGSQELIIASHVHVDEYRANTDGTFQVVTLNSIGRPATAMFLVDMDGDGRRDIVTVGNGDVNILRNTGAASFALPVAYAAGSATTAAILDVNADGTPDVITADGSSPQIFALRNTAGKLDSIRVVAWNAAPVTGPTTLSKAHPSLTSATSGFAVTTADMNGDGYPDLVAADRTTGDILIFNGAATGLSASPDFSTRLPQPGTPPASYISDIKTGDFDNDGNVDIAALSGDGKTVYVLYRDKAGSITSSTTFTFTNPLCCIEVADMNGDNRADLVYAEQQGTLGVLLSNGSTFAPAATYGTTSGVTALAIGDLNGDKSPDVVLATNNGGAVDAFRGSSNGALVGTAEVQTNGITSLAIAPFGTYNSIVAVGNDLELIAGDPTLALPARLGYSLPTPGSAVQVVDVNADGFADVVVASSGALNAEWFLTSFINDGKDAFNASPTIGTDKQVQSLAAADFQLKGAPDVVMSEADKLLFALNRCAPPHLALSVRPYSNPPVQPLTYIAESLSEFDQPVSFAITENGRTLTSTAADPKDVSIARMTLSLPAGTHVLTAVATLSDGSTISSNPLTVTVEVPPPSRSRPARH